MGVESADGPIEPVYFRCILFGQLMKLLRNREQLYPHLRQERLERCSKALRGSFAQLSVPLTRR
jgi:hypothetical protein